MPNNSNDDRTLGKSIIIEPQHIIAASVMTQIWHRQNRLQHADLRKIRRMASFGDFALLISLFVEYLPEEEAASSCSRNTGCARNVSVQKLRYGAWTFLAQPNTNEESDHAPHLLVQESIPPHDECDTRTYLLDLERKYVPYGRLKHPMRIGGERRKVMPSNKAMRSILHCGDIKPLMHERPVGSKARRKDVRIIQEIPVFLTLRILAGIKIRLCVRCLHHSDVLRKPRVHGPGQIRRRYRLGKIEMRHKAFGVNTCVGTGRPEHSDRCTVQVFQDLFQLLLDRYAVALKLITGVVGSVISKNYLIPFLHLQNLRIPAEIDTCNGSGWSRERLRNHTCRDPQPVKLE